MIYTVRCNSNVLDEFKIIYFQAVLIIENVLQKYGTYENFEERVAGKVLTRAQITNCIKRYLKAECLEDEVLVNLSEDMLSRGSMTRSKGRAVLNVRVVNMRENWLDGLLRHEIGKLEARNDKKTLVGIDAHFPVFNNHQIH